MSIKFAILKAVTMVGQNVQYDLVLQYNQNQVIDRLVIRTNENVSSGLQMEAAIRKAWSDLITEFKQQTIALP